MFSIRDPFERKRKVGARPACPNPVLMIEGPPVTEPAVVSQLGELCRLAGADREASVECQRVQTQTETASIGAHTQIDGSRGFMEMEVEDDVTFLISNRRRHTEHKETFDVVLAKYTMREVCVERPDIDRQLRMLEVDERNDIEHKHRLAERIAAQVENQTRAIPVRPDPVCVRQGPASTEQPLAVPPRAEPDAMLRLHRTVDLSKGQRVQMKTETACIGAHTQLERARRFIEMESELSATLSVSKRRRHTEHHSAFDVVVTKDAMREVHIVRPDIDHQLRMPRRDERNDVEHEHRLAERITAWLDHQTARIPVGPDAASVR